MVHSFARRREVKRGSKNAQAQDDGQAYFRPSNSGTS